MNFKAVLFDLGSTLIYFDGHWPDVIQRGNQALLETLRANGLEIDESKFVKQFRQELERYYAERELEFIEHTTAYLLRRLLAEFGYSELPSDIIQSALAAMYAVSQAHWIPEADTHTTLEQLQRQSYRLGLISNAGDDTDVQTLIDKAGLRPYFEIILTSAAEGIRKPNPRIFWTALDSLGIEPENAVMVGDTLGADILGAKNAGLFSIWITRRANSPANHAHQDTIKPDAKIATLKELPDLLKQVTAT